MFWGDNTLSNPRQEIPSTTVGFGYSVTSKPVVRLARNQGRENQPRDHIATDTHHQLAGKESLGQHFAEPWIFMFFRYLDTAIGDFSSDGFHLPQNLVLGMQGGMEFDQNSAGDNIGFGVVDTRNLGILEQVLLEQLGESALILNKRYTYPQPVRDLIMDDGNRFQSGVFHKPNIKVYGFPRDRLAGSALTIMIAARKFRLVKFFVSRLHATSLNGSGSNGYMNRLSRQGCLFLACGLMLSGCAVVSGTEETFAGRVERIFRYHNRVANDLIEQAEMGGEALGPLEDAEAKMLARCQPLNEAVGRAMSGEEAGIVAGIALGDTISACESASRTVEELLSRPTQGGATASNSTSKINAALGGITRPAPVSP